MTTRAVTAIGLLTLNLAVVAQSVAEPADELAAAARAVAENQVTVSDDVQRSLDALIERMQSPAWLAAQNKWRREVQGLTGTVSAPEAEDGEDVSIDQTEDRLIVFVSSSVPLTTLRNYARDLQKVHGLMVFRGMLGGMRTIAPTLNLIANILRMNPACEGQHCAMRSTAVVIDPILFREHAVSRVPAAVFVEDMALAPYCERIDEQVPPQRPKHIVVGDVSLKSLAEELQRLLKTRRLDPLIRSLR